LELQEYTLTATDAEVEITFQRLVQNSNGMLGETQVWQHHGSKRKAIIAFLDQMYGVTENMEMVREIARTTESLGLPDCGVEGMPTFGERARQAEEIFEF
jgi:uncharacterized protein related to proFAR isomerase